MKTTFGKRIHYWFENFLSKGGVSIFLSLLILFLIAFGLTLLLRVVFVMLNPGDDIVASFFNHVWTILLEISDPGSLGVEGGYFWYRIAGIAAIFTGVIIFSMLIAFITTQLEETIYNFKKGKSRVIESGHTLILGWNERVFDIISELMAANESRKKASIVILSEKDKEEMDDEISKKFPHRKTTKVITRCGDTASLTELKRVNAGEAKSAIILSPCIDSSNPEEKDASDTKTIKIILALIVCQDGENKMAIVAEIFDDEKKAILDSLRLKKVISLKSREILGKILVQTSLSSGLEIVYSELFSFMGNEIYPYKAEWGEASFGSLACDFGDGIPLGIINSENIVELNPPYSRKMESNDTVFILAQDDSTISFRKKICGEPNRLSLEKKTIFHGAEKELILGWHSIGGIVLKEYEGYLLKGSAIDIMIDDPSDRIREQIKSLQKELKTLKIRLIGENPLSRGNLKKIKPFTYNNIIILAQDENDYSPEKVDSDTLLILLLLREIIREEGIAQKGTKIITQVLNSDNEELIEHSNADDFIISNKMITKIMAQISENPEIKILYDSLFSREGSEIYLKPVSYYFGGLPVEIPFLDLLYLAQQRNETCLGVRFGALARDPENNFGVILNPPKDRKVALKEGDYLVVLAEDDR